MTVLDEKLNYDVDNRLIGVNVNGTQQRWTVFDGQNPYLDFNGSGNLTERYITDPRAIAQFFAREAANGAVNWYLTDKLGSIRDIVDMSGNVLDAVNYGTYGSVIYESNPANGDRFKFDGGEYDGNLSLYHFGARWQDPNDGRWISQDPLGLGPGSNPYLYVGNSPINFKDSTGLDPMMPAAQRQAFFIRGLQQFFDKEIAPQNFAPLVNWFQQALALANQGLNFGQILGQLGRPPSPPQAPRSGSIWGAIGGFVEGAAIGFGVGVLTVFVVFGGIALLPVTVTVTAGVVVGAGVMGAVGGGAGGFIIGSNQPNFGQGAVVAANNPLPYMAGVSGGLYGATGLRFPTTPVNPPGGG